MPGILYHLAFAEEVYRNFSEQMKLDKVNFMAGNLIPDLLTIEKRLLLMDFLFPLWNQ